MEEETFSSTDANAVHQEMTQNHQLEDVLLVVLLLVLPIVVS